MGLAVAFKQELLAATPLWSRSGPLADTLKRTPGTRELADVVHAGWRGEVLPTLSAIEAVAGRTTDGAPGLLCLAVALHVPAQDQRNRAAVLASIRNVLPPETAWVLTHVLNARWQGDQRLGDVVAGGPLVDRSTTRHLALRGLLRPLFAEGSGDRLDGGDSAWGERMRFFDAVECGRVVEASTLAGRALAHAPNQEAPLVRAYISLAWLVQAVLGRHIPDPARSIDGPSAPWRHIGEPALERQVRDAFISVLGRPEDVPIPGEVGDAVLHAHGHAGVLPIRQALARRQWDVAAALLARRSALGCETWLDRALALRLELNREQRPGAGTASLLLEVAESCDARGRCDFELRAADELSPMDLLRTVMAQPTARPTVGGPGGLVGSSRAMQAVRSTIARYAPSDLPVLLRGASGTGKEVAARALHESSPRRRQPFVAVNCAALAEGLLESELFGHARGAFSGADTARAGLINSAATGTLFLDEIGEISRHFQAALLRLLENGEYRAVGSDIPSEARCRIIAATNADLDAMVADGRFRADLFYRLSRLELRLPALAGHADDIDEIVAHLLAQARGGRMAQITPELMAHLRIRPWPGNVRELRNRLEAMVALHPACERYGLAEYGEEAVMPVEAQPAWAAPGLDSDPGRGARMQRLRAAFLEQRAMTRAEAVRLLGVAPMTATTYLAELCRLGVIRKVRPNAAPRSHYFESVPTERTGPAA